MVRRPFGPHPNPPRAREGSRAAGAAFWLLCVATAALAAPPEIAAVRGARTRVVYGVGLVPGAVELRAWSPQVDDAALLEALAAPTYGGRALLPAEPPAEAVKRSVVDVDVRGLALAADFEEPVCWVRNADGWSKPAVTGTAQPLLAYPNVAYAGDGVRLWGQALEPRLVALRAADGSHVVPLDRTAVSALSPNEVWLQLPGDLPVGAWQVYVHNGQGGLAGWGGPVSFRLQARPPTPINVTFVDARLHGSRGNGVVDETNSLRQALIVAARTRDTVVLPPGRYPLRGTLEIPPGVSLVGAGPGNTVIEVQDGQPFVGGFPMRADLDGVARDLQAPLRGSAYAPMVWLRDQSTLSNVTLEAGPGVGMGIMVAACPGTARDIRIERCRIRCGQTQRGQMPATGVVVAGDTERFVLRDCSLEGHDGLTFLSAANVSALVARNDIRCVPHGRYTGLTLRGLTDSVVIDNRLADGAPNLRIGLDSSRGQHEVGNGQRVPLASFARTVFAGNQLLGGEQPAVLAPWPGARAEVFWQGQPKSGDEATLTVDGEPFWTGISDSYVVVTAGRGVGQYRRVVSNTTNTVTVSPAWDVAPDAGSQIVIDGCLADTLWLGQRDQRRGPWDYLFGLSVGNVVGDLDLSGGGGLLLGDLRGALPGPSAYNQLLRCAVSGGGQIRLAGAGVVGNVLSECSVRGNDQPEALSISAAGGDAPTQPRAGWNLAADLDLRDTRTGIHVAGSVEHLILRGNHIEARDRALVDETGQVVQR